MANDYSEKYSSGWIKLYRSLMYKGWYKKPDHLRLWIHILLKASHSGNQFYFNGKNIYLKPGQFITGRKKLAIEIGISESKIERILNFFEKSEQQIEQHKTNKNRIVTVLNWTQYQQNEQQIEQQVNNKRTTSEQQVNTIKNDKNIKNVKKKDIPEKSATYSADVLKLASQFKNTLPKKLWPKNSVANQWLDVLDKCIRLDGYSYEQIKEIIEDYRNDAFWQNNFYSPIKLRRRNQEGIKYIDLFWQKMQVAESDGMTQEEREIKKHNEKVFLAMGLNADGTKQTKTTELCEQLGTSLRIAK